MTIFASVPIGGFAACLIAANWTASGSDTADGQWGHSFASTRISSAQKGHFRFPGDAAITFWQGQNQKARE
jgi:hypothetical protein